jgi:hypothetical protein
MKQSQVKPAPPPAPVQPADTEGLGAAEIGLAGTAVLIRHHLEEVRRGQIDVRSRRGSWWRNWAWVAGTALLLTAYGLAVDAGSGSIGRRLLDALSILGFTSSRAPHNGWEHVASSDLAHLVIAFAGLSVLVAVFSDRLAEVRARLRSGHAVICGVGDTGLRSARALKAAGYRITCLDTDVGVETAHEAREAGALVLHRNATHVGALETARVDRAAYVVCTGPEDAMNTRVASLVVGLVQARGGGRAPSIHVHINDADLAQILRGPLASVGAARLHFFNVASVWARTILDARGGPFSELGSEAPRIIVLGSSNLASAVVVGAARRWHDHARAAGTDARLSITVVAAAAAELCAAISGRYPAIARVCDLIPVVHAPSAGAPFGTAIPDSAEVYACLDDASANLALALEAERQIGEQARVFLPATAAAATLGPLLLGVGRIRPIVLPEDAEVLHDQMRELLARQIHNAYLQSRRGEPNFGKEAADRRWKRLAEDFRQSNRAQADGMIEQLRAVWYDIEPLYDWDEEPAQLSDAPVEAMAELEHVRWCRDRRARGWQYGPERDNKRKRHPLLQPWTDLPPDQRRRNCDRVRSRPRILARAGFKLARDPAREALARRLHERYLHARAAEGERPPLAAPWYELPEQARDANRAAVDDIAVKLAGIGRLAAPAIVTAAEVVFTEAEVEQLARLEHERWLAQRRAAGWSLGPRDDEARTHPSFVPWDELPESEREKDREVVRGIPDLLASIGYTVVGEAGG